MRIEHGNSYRYVVDQNMAKLHEKAKGEVVLPAVKKQQPAEVTMEERQNEKEAYLAAMGLQVETSGEQMKAEKEKLKILLTCLEISRRLAGGDKVPPADHRYLMKHDAGLYARSVMMRFPKSNPHEYKRLSKEDECQDKLQISMADEAACLEWLRDASVPAGGAVLDVNV
ncbi:hypothetical protein [Hydrogenoanaerobacterium sp.]|uniref:hypothetical protein n=1 Tax=Hydrogenoanaerobacterium sp. TaxID=2953763 RepID=UPI00289FDA85|nr:hypothetical protein [Hydrogenoanaerobacterium sp.]